MAFQQDLTPVVLGNRKGGSGSSKTTGGGSRELSGLKKPQSTGLNGKLDNSTAHKLDSADAKAPETVGLEVGKVRQARKAVHQTQLTCISLHPGDREGSERQRLESA